MPTAAAMVTLLANADTPNELPAGCRNVGNPLSRMPFVPAIQRSGPLVTCVRIRFAAKFSALGLMLPCRLANP